MQTIIEGSNVERNQIRSPSLKRPVKPLECQIFVSKASIDSPLAPWADKFSLRTIIQLSQQSPGFASLSQQSKGIRAQRHGAPAMGQPFPRLTVSVCLRQLTEGL